MVKISWKIMKIVVKIVKSFKIDAEFVKTVSKSIKLKVRYCSPECQAEGITHKIVKIIGTAQNLVHKSLKLTEKQIKWAQNFSKSIKSTKKS